MISRSITCYFFALFSFLQLPAQQLPPEATDARLPDGFWEAVWISHPTASKTDWGIFHFRRTVSLPAAPERFVVHVSGDNRYRLYVNGREVVHGPMRDDLDHWRYESIDLAPYLQAGDNVLAAVVWNFGEHRPVFQNSYRTAFLLQADDPAHAAVNTSPEGWKVWSNDAYAPEVEAIRALQTYHVVGPGERLDAARYPWGWQTADFDDTEWLAPMQVEAAYPATLGTVYAWGLLPRSLPLMEDREVRLAKVRRSEGATVPVGFLAGDEPLIIPARTTATLLFDQDHLTNAYPIVWVSGGSGSEVRLTYAESLYQPGGGPNDKGNRDVVEGKVMKGQQDVFLPDGGQERTYRPLWFRTYRYLQLEVTTTDVPLIIEDLYGRFTGYPFEERGRFESDDVALGRIWDVGWRTARLCAGETYYDCPYYEQLQYVGDTRIQALISLYVAGDDRLMRQAIDVYDHSREAMGLTHSRYPERRPVQFIPPYSLFWVSMVYDFWMHREDRAYVEEKVKGVDPVLTWFDEQVDPETKLIGAAPYWNFVDWAWSWIPQLRQGGVPPLEGGSSILTLHYAYTLAQAADLCRATGRDAQGEGYAQRADELRRAVLEQCWDERRGLLADTPAKADFSQHANIFGILTGAIPAENHTAVMEKVLTEAELTQATFYFQFYLFEALHRLGWGDRYLDLLQPWRDMLARGLTTFAEEPDPTRSDCHAWSASPNYHFLSLVAGIRPAAPGFQQVEIAPSLGTLQEVKGSFPHPEGMIEVDLRRRGDAGLTGTVTLPDELSGRFRWAGREMDLRPGKQAIEF